MADSKPLIDVTNINEKVYSFIRDRIIHLSYPPGHKINLRDLRQELGVSQTPIKDALFRLAGEGMVDISSRRGTFVKEVYERDIEEIFATRFILEAGAVDLIADRITTTQLGQLDHLYRETVGKGQKFEYDMFMEKDRAFHAKIVEFTGNQRLIDMYRNLSAHIQIVRFRFARHSSTKLPWVDSDHKSILAGLRQRDAEKTKKAIRSHFEKFLEALLQKKQSFPATSGNER